MRSRNAFLFAALMLFSGAAGPVTCSQRLADDEAKLFVIAGKVRAGVRMAAQDLQGAIDLLCANGNTINNGVINIKSAVAAGGPGPKTDANLKIADQALNALNGVCSASPGVGNPVTLAALFRQGYAAYLAAKSSAASATAAAANGT
jgi:hypothetical protein